MDDDLPVDYDVIVIGTGMPECILAAAHARNGRRVLHIDSHAYYGGLWASFNFTGLESWFTETKTDEKGASSFDQYLQDGETAKCVRYRTDVVSNVCIRANIPHDDEEEETANTEETKNLETATCDQSSEESSENAVCAKECILENVEEISSQSPQEAAAPPKEEAVAWSVTKLKSQYRKFNLDLAPKLLFSRGELVELLISSNIARYAEFKSVSRVLTYLDGRLQQVPCSRADVFSTKNVSIVEKRMLMKLLTYCMNYEQHPEEYEGFEGKTFLEFLRSRKLTHNIVHYVVHAIAMVPEDASTLQGLKATRMFLNSLGLYGNTPFLWPLYGSGELPQCFCRLCAVFGGIYYLQRDVQAVIINSENVCTGIVSGGKRLHCKWLVMDANYAPSQFVTEGYGTKRISRSIVISDRSMVPAEKEQVTFLRLPRGNGSNTSVSAIELGPSAMVCPEGLHVVYLTSDSVKSAEDDLRAAADLLFATTSTAVGNGEDETPKPTLLWSVSFDQTICSAADFTEQVPCNVFLTCPPSNSISFDDAVVEARQLFLHAFPNEEFLPRAPDPEEIVIEDAEEARPEPELAKAGNQSNEAKESEPDSAEEVVSASLDGCSIAETTPTGDVSVMQSTSVPRDSAAAAEALLLL